MAAVAVEVSFTLCLILHFDYNLYMYSTNDSTRLITLIIVASSELSRLCCCVIVDCDGNI